VYTIRCLNQIRVGTGGTKVERNGGMAEKEGKKHSMVSRVVLYRRVQLPYRCVRVSPSAEAKRRRIRVAEEKEKQQRDGRSRVALVGGSATERTKDPATPEDPTQRCG